MMNFSKKQIQEILNKHALKKGGVKDIIEMTYDAIMFAERQSFLETQKEDKNKANGYRSVKQTVYGRQLRLAIPRDRLGLFKPLLLGVLREEAEEMYLLAFELYREGLTTRRIGKIFETIYKKSYDINTISAMSRTFQEQLKAWRERKLDQHYPCLIIDCIQAKVRRERVSGEAFYTVIGVKEDFSREIVAIYNSPTEGASTWKEVLQNIKERGVETVNLIIADGLKGLEDAVLSVFPNVRFQKCVTHFKRNVLRRAKPGDKKAIAEDMKPIFETTDNTHTKEKAHAMVEEFVNKWGKKYPVYKKMFKPENIRCYLTFLDFNYKIRPMIYTTNWVERLNKEFRRALKIRNAMPSVESVLFLLSAIAMDMEQGAYSYKMHLFEEEPIFEQKNMNF